MLFNRKYGLISSTFIASKYIHYARQADLQCRSLGRNQTRGGKNKLRLRQILLDKECNEAKKQHKVEYRIVESMPQAKYACPANKWPAINLAEVEAGNIGPEGKKRVHSTGEPFLAISLSVDKQHCLDIEWILEMTSKWPHEINTI